VVAKNLTFNVILSPFRPRFLELLHSGVGHPDILDVEGGAIFNLTVTATSSKAIVAAFSSRVDGSEN
jgi:hypothetical protein